MLYQFDNLHTYYTKMETAQKFDMWEYSYLQILLCLELQRQKHDMNNLNR